MVVGQWPNVWFFIRAPLSTLPTSINRLSCGLFQAAWNNSHSPAALFANRSPLEVALVGYAHSGNTQGDLARDWVTE